MDPVSHAVLGQTIAVALGRPASPLRTRLIAGVVGALAPDADAVVMPLGWDLYLRVHEIGTHSLAASLPVAGIAAVIAGTFARGSPKRDLFAASWLGCVSHIVLDVLSGARIQIGWPLVPGRVSLPLVAMAEPWLIAIFVAGAVAMAMSRSCPRATASAVAAVVVAFLGVKAALLIRALPPDSSAQQGPLLARIVEARWASLTEWYVFERRADTLTQWKIEPGRAPVLLLSWPVVADSLLVRSSRSLGTVRNFLAVHELGFAGEVPAAGGGWKVLWSDVRFCWRPDAAGAEASPVLSVRTRGGTDRIACGLWFGGKFDPNGRVVSQLVKVGAWWQTRPPEP